MWSDFGECSSKNSVLCVGSAPQQAQAVRSPAMQKCRKLHSDAEGIKPEFERAGENKTEKASGGIRKKS